MNKLEAAKKRLMDIVNKASTEQLIAAWNYTERSTDPTAPVIRGAIMERMERENADKFWAWVDSDEPAIESFYC